MNEAKRLALEARGYDTIFEHLGNTIAINSSNFSKEKEKQLEEKFDLKTFREEDGNLVFYNPKEWRLQTGILHPIKRKVKIPYGAKSLAAAFNGLEYDDKEYDFSEWDLKGVESLNYLFYYCMRWKNFTVRDWDLSTVLSMVGMFAGCSNAEELPVENWNVSNVLDMQELFYGCSSLRRLDLSGWDLRSLKCHYNMFKDCISLEEVVLGPGSYILKEQLQYLECRIILKDGSIDAF